MTDGQLVLFGPGYCGAAVAAAARGAGYRIVTVGRGGAARLDDATHLLSTVPPDAAGDPILHRFGAAIDGAPVLRWIGYLSTTGVYGDRGGGWVDEATSPAPAADRSHRRLAAERAWVAAAGGRALDIFRLAGIYGPGRSAFDDLRAGRARRIDRAGPHVRPHPSRRHRRRRAGGDGAAPAAGRPHPEPGRRRAGRVAGGDRRGGAPAGRARRRHWCHSRMHGRR